MPMRTRDTDASPAALECAGQLTPKPSGITTSSAPLYASDSSIPRNRAYACGRRHSAVTEPRSSRRAMIATRIGAPDLTADRSMPPSRS